MKDINISFLLFYSIAVSKIQIFILFQKSKWRALCEKLNLRIAIPIIFKDTNNSKLAPMPKNPIFFENFHNYLVPT